MFNIFIGKNLIASFSFLKDARAYVNHVMVSQFSRKGYDLIAVNFPRNLQKEPQKFVFGSIGSYIIIFISKS